MSSSQCRHVGFSQIRPRFRMILHLTSITTGGAHPSAVNATEMVLLPGVPLMSPDEMQCQLIVCDSLVGVVVRPDSVSKHDYCRVLNWKTGFVAEVCLCIPSSFSDCPNACIIDAFPTTRQISLVSR